ncbi:MAG TPA: hypothetical protein VKK79_25800, partial [Candidatus Lokiarchaeia archaeon]|nr:hypothetical protein [Candidatus Lokiarchaeia archaeon]
MELSTLNWIDGITGSCVVILGVIFGVIFFRESQIKKAKMLKPLALLTIFAGLMYLGVLVDFTAILATGHNFPNDAGQLPLLSYIWFGPLLVVAIYLAASVQYPDIVWHFVRTAIGGAVIYYVLLFWNPLGSFIIGTYDTTTPSMIDYTINWSSPAGIFFGVLFAFIIVLFALGLMYQGTKTTGTLKGKFNLLAIGAICYGIAGALEGFAILSLSWKTSLVGIILVRALYLFSFWIMYYGLR